MQSLSEHTCNDLLQFVIHQCEFILHTTRNVKTYHDFLTSMDAMVLFNSTCMCLQSIGETIKKIDDHTQGKFFAHYPETPWKKVIGLRNIISHEYLSVDPQIIFMTVRTRLEPLLQTLRQILSDIEQGKRDAELNA
ncbi:MAG: DUF86 domain-containing protein [Bacteroidales bacterium]|nr:DUF86 domain-containing protein [Bacteroidales bacterium]